MFEGNATEPYPFSDFLETLDYLVHDVLKMDLLSGCGRHHIYAGTHMLRKTAMFLLAYWGIKLGMMKHGKMNIHDEGIPIKDIAAIYNDSRMLKGSPRNDSILSDGRHKSSTSTMTYLGDAATLFGLYCRLGRRDPDQMVGPTSNLALRNKCQFQDIVSFWLRGIGHHLACHLLHVGSNSFPHS
ncbi:unnamed protein product, partial [Cylindrotheca closterium]